MVTLKDIARSTGVSISTVSRVLSGKDPKAASKEVQKRIWAYVEENGYVPNRNARNLRTGATEEREEGREQKYYACVYARSRGDDDEFFSELSATIESEAYRLGYVQKYSFYANNLGTGELVEALKSPEISGIIVLGRFEEERMNAIMAAFRNVVCVGLNSISDKHDCVLSSGYKAGLLAMKTLYDLGHRDIAYIGMSENENRYRSYCDALREYGIPFRRSLIVDTRQGSKEGYNAALTLLGRKASFSAVFSANDATAIGVMKALAENGVRVPEDVSVIGIDDIETSRYVTPSLTTVHIPIRELGVQAAKTLVDRAEGGHRLPQQIELPFSLALRASTGKRLG